MEDVAEHFSAAKGLASKYSPIYAEGCVVHQSLSALDFSHPPSCFSFTSSVHHSSTQRKASFAKSEGDIDRGQSASSVIMGLFAYSSPKLESKAARLLFFGKDES